ncbi:MAG: hypothetical protein V2B20_06700 [Pseudomonadota bacterium]
MTRFSSSQSSFFSPIKIVFWLCILLGGLPIVIWVGTYLLVAGIIRKEFLTDLTWSLTLEGLGEVFISPWGMVATLLAGCGIIGLHWMGRFSDPKN